MLVRHFKTQHLRYELLLDDIFLLLSLTKLLYHQEGKEMYIFFKDTLSSGEYKDIHKYSDKDNINLDI